MTCEWKARLHTHVFCVFHAPYPYLALYYLFIDLDIINVECGLPEGRG